MATKKESKTQQEQAKANAHLLRPKGEPRLMPKDYSISLASKGGTDRQLLNPATKRVSTIGNMGNLSTAKMLFHS